MRLSSFIQALGAVGRHQTNLRRATTKVLQPPKPTPEKVKQIEEALTAIQVDCMDALIRLGCKKAEARERVLAATKDGADISSFDNLFRATMASFHGGRR